MNGEKKNNGEKRVLCQITKRYIKLKNATPGSVIRSGILEVIRKKYPNFSTEGYITTEVLKKFRKEYIEDMLEMEKGELSKLDEEVVDSMVEHETLAQNVEREYEQHLSLGDRMADAVAEFGGSWKFIILFGVLMTGWMVLNAIILSKKPFDPYPFILLNLMLSTIAALQAPVIMMSQNRKEAKDRLRAENDYKVNLKAELEIRNLHEKLDQLKQQQWRRLLEIQQVQMDLFEDAERKRTFHGRKKRFFKKKQESVPHIVSDDAAEPIAGE